MLQIRNQAARQIVVARNTLKTGLSAYSAATALAAAAQTTFDAALAAYRNGVGSITDVAIAERQLLVAKNAATDAYSTALSAAATLALRPVHSGPHPPNEAAQCCCALFEPGMTLWSQSLRGSAVMQWLSGESWSLVSHTLQFAGPRWPARRMFPPGRPSSWPGLKTARRSGLRGCCIEHRKGDRDQC
jgi:Outer membrane efflux protein